MKNISRIIGLAKPYRVLLFAVSGTILLSAVLQQVSPLLIKSVVDVISGKLSGMDTDVTVLYRLLLAILGFNILGVIVDTVSDRIGDAVSARIGLYLVRRFYNHIFRLPQSYFDTNISGKIVNQLTRGIATIGDFIGTATNFFLPVILQTILSIGILTYYSAPIGLLALAIFPVYIIVSHYSTKRWGTFEIKKNALEDRYKSRIAEVIQNMKLVKTANTQQNEYSKIAQFSKKYIRISDEQSVSYHILNFARNSALELILIIIVLITFNGTFNGLFTLGEMVLIIQLLNQLRRPLFSMSYILERIQRAESGAKEYFEILSLPASETYPRNGVGPVINKPTLKLDNVTFSYDSAPISKKVSLTINPGETVALIGPSGAGKTTLVNLLLKLYDPTDGRIYINDSLYKQLSHSFIRSHFSYVFQDNELFSSTVLDNVEYGHRASQKEVAAALKAAHAYDFVQDLPQGLNTEIGERGVKLSGGQKQRIQIARAILSPAPVLVLDEATSSLDAKSEALIQDALLALTRKKTVIIIAHRFSTLQHVDRIVVVDNGKIVDQGSPGELASRPGIFMDLLRYQIEGNQKLLAKYEILS